ncbi:MAG: flavin reductase family protein [Alphaproteobacteria bacterium]|nr:flavin reductase family protein [Alphaproteobacteria bacterium]
MSQDGRQFRNALGCFATGVCVVTTKDGASGGIGLTINSFTSVSLDPPLVLWCLDKSSDRFATFTQADRFCIHVLDERAREASQRLARKGGGVLEIDEFAQDVSGLPILNHALAHFVCERHAVHDAGDHVIILGAVRDFSSAASGRPLVYFRGAYRMLEAFEPGENP